jgi:hypothetical protein
MAWRRHIDVYEEPAAENKQPLKVRQALIRVATELVARTNWNGQHPAITRCRSNIGQRRPVDKYSCLIRHGSIDEVIALCLVAPHSRTVEHGG